MLRNSLAKMSGMSYLPGFAIPLLNALSKSHVINNGNNSNGGGAEGDGPGDKQDQQQQPKTPKLSPEQQALAMDIAARLEKDPMLSHSVIDKMSGESRRRLLVNSVTHEWYGAEHVKKQLSAADADMDTKISKRDYRLWIRHSMTTSEKAGQGMAPAAIPWAYVFRIAIVAGCPFVAFGLLDNSVMLLSGDAIDSAFGERFNLSQMGAAALGGICSGVAGIQIHGVAEKAVQKLGLRAPDLTPTQARNPLVFRANHLGGTLGLFIGLICGMWPLLVISTTSEEGGSSSHTASSSSASSTASSTTDQAKS